MVYGFFSYLQFPESRKLQGGGTLSEKIKIGTATRSFHNDPHCGDRCGWWEDEERIILCMVDGLGHGIEAEIAAKAAVDYVSEHLREPLSQLFSGCDRAIKHTRGAVMSIVIIDREKSSLSHGGVGNINVMVYGKKKARLSSDWGIIGGGYRKLHIETVEMEPDTRVFLWTDGITERLDILEYEGLLYGDVQELADKILQDHAKETDDATIMIY